MGATLHFFVHKRFTVFRKEHRPQNKKPLESSVKIQGNIFLRSCRLRYGPTPGYHCINRDTNKTGIIGSERFSLFFSSRLLFISAKRLSNFRLFSNFLRSHYLNRKIQIFINVFPMIGKSPTRNSIWNPYRPNNISSQIISLTIAFRRFF